MLAGGHPDGIRMDVSGLMLGKQLRANELPIDTAKMKLITEPERVLAHVVALKVEEEKPVEAVAAETATPAEPEVIKKGKKEVEGEEAPRQRPNRRRMPNLKQKRAKRAKEEIIRCCVKRGLRQAGCRKKVYAAHRRTWESRSGVSVDAA